MVSFFWMLDVDEAFDAGAEFFEQLVVALGHGAGDDERRAGVVDEHGVHFVHDGVVVRALHEVEGAGGHVVAQVVEAEFVVGAEGDVGQVGLPSFLGVGAVLVDAVHAEAVEHVEGSHPFGVALGEVVVHRDHVHAPAGQGVEEYGEGGDEGLAFAGGHFGYLALVQDDAAEELDVVVYHVPFVHVAACHPFVLIIGLVAVDADKVVLGGEGAVEVVGGDYHFVVLGEAAGGVLHDGEGFGQYFVQRFLVLVGDFLFQLVHLVVYLLALVDFGGFYLALQLGDAVALGLHVVLDVLLDGFGACAQFVVAQLLYLFVCLLDAFHIRLNLFQVALGFVAEQLFQYVVKSHVICLFLSCYRLSVFFRAGLKNRTKIMLLPEMRACEKVL